MCSNRPSRLPAHVYPTDAPISLFDRALTPKEQSQYTRFFLDEAGTTTANTPSDFPFTPSQLIELFKFTALRLFITADSSVLAENFRFVGPVVGPLNKCEFVNRFFSFNLSEGFPDHTSGIHSLRVDPFDPRCVWFTTRFEGENTGKLAGGSIEPTGKWVNSGSETASMTFDNEGKVVKLTVGYVMDKEVGNTGGLGAVFGIVYAIGRAPPFPEAWPWRKSWQYRIFEWIQGLILKPAKEAIEDTK